VPEVVLALGRAADSRFERLHARHGKRYLDIYETEYAIGGQLFMLIAAVVLALALKLSTHQFVATVIVTQVASLAGIAAGIVHIRRGPAKPLLEWWGNGRPDDGVAAAWPAAVELARHGFLIHLAYSVVLTAVPIAIFGGSEYHLTVAGTLLLFLSLLCAAVWPVVLGLLVGELWMRPVIRDLAGRVTPEERGPAHGIWLNPKLVFALPAVNVGTGGFVVILLAVTSNLSFSEVSTGVLLSIGLSSTTSLILTLLIARQVMEPLDNLLAATSRVGAGDLGTRLPVLGTDEFGNVNANFNTMVSELQRARERLVATREEERRRIRRDLHDGLGPTLAAVPVHLDAARRIMRADPDAAEQMLDELAAETRGAIGDIRRLVRDLRPPSLDELGLMGALEDVARRVAGQDGGLVIDVNADPALGPLPAAVEVAAYRIGQEALTNVLRHAGARHALLRIAVDDGLVLEVVDDGCGVPPGAGAGIGLSSMRERASEVGGTCTVEPRPEGGTRVHARLPLAPEAGR
jgi:signal transduction histidine kinase